MSKKLLFMWIVIVGAVESFFIFPFTVWGGTFQPLASVVLMVPIIAVGIIWYLMPKKLWTLSLTFTYAVLAFFLFIFVATIYQNIENAMASVSYSFITGLKWTAVLMGPVGLIYLINHKFFKSSIKDETIVEPDTLTVD